MNARLILLGMVAGLVLPLAAANAGANFGPDLKQVGANANLVGNAAPGAENFGRDEYDKTGDKGGYDNTGDYDHQGDDHQGDDHQGDYDHHGDDHRGDYDHHDDHQRDKSPCKPK
ncbi:MAG TPA: hypothetical protein VIY90_24650 [Steroidobacteraceae bacterium]